VLCHYWLGDRKGIWPVKNGVWWRWALVGLDGVAPSRMVNVSAIVSLPLHNKVQKFSPGTDSPRRSRKKGHKMVLVWWLLIDFLYSLMNDIVCSLIRHNDNIKKRSKKAAASDRAEHFKTGGGTYAPTMDAVDEKNRKPAGSPCHTSAESVRLSAHYYSQSKLMHSSSSDCCACCCVD